MMARLSLLLLILVSVGFGPTPSRAYDAPVLNVSVDRGVALTLSAPATSVFIANPDVADVQVMSPTSIMVFGKKTGETTLMATDNNGTSLLHRTVVVSQDLSDLRRELLLAIPNARIGVEALPDGLILTGEVRDPASIEDARKIAARYLTKDGVIINRVKVVGSNQIMIRVRFAEVSKTVTDNFGINWSNLTTVGGFVFGLASGVGLAPLASVASTNIPTLNGETTGGTNPVNGLAFSHAGAHTNVNGLIDALAQDGLVNILAEPNLTAMSGETANFLAGGQVPVPIPQANGTISIQYMPYGVSLEFTPTIVSENRINLHVKPEVSELSTIGAISVSNLTAPAFTTRKAETTVELASGQSFAVAGLLDNDQDQTVNKFPFLGDVPILGALFRSTQFQNNQTELVIIITPYIVKGGGSEQALALPMDNYSPPSQSERLLELRTSSGDPTARPLSGETLARPAPIPPPPAPESAVPADLTPLSMPAPDEVPLIPAVPEENLKPQPTPMSLPSSHTEVVPAPTMPLLPTAAAPTSTNGPNGPGGFLLE
jgi:pilus assembly protein CpaC